MLKRTLLFFLLLCFVHAAFSQEIQSPEKFLGYKLGSQFTPHYKVAEYFRYVAKASKNTKLEAYGSTNENRPLMVLFVASHANIARLDEIRRHNLHLAGLEKDATAISDAPVIVWLSYNVHGNEPASSEAAMQTLFELVDPANARTKAWLKNTVVVMDPCLNPDGHDRYVNFYNSVKGVVPNPDPASREHSEPWPGGRVNHYYFDLNRDWAWQTQKETQERMALYNQWLPQVHVDYHEQGYNAPYYFAPAAEPFHKDITAWQREFQTIIGKNNAKYFDQNGWMYFTKQEFDLLYPSYGDTYPTYNGAIGMTFEQGGISAGLAVVTRAGDTLTLADRIAHHRATALSTIETASEYAQKLLNEYQKFFSNSQLNPPGDYKTYVVKNDNRDKITALAKLLDRNGILFGFGLSSRISGYDYATGKTVNYTAGRNDLVISAYQPKSVLLNVLFEPKTFLADSDTYDITAWSLPYAYGLKAYGVKESLKPQFGRMAPEKPQTAAGAHAYAYVSSWQSVGDVKFLAALLNKRIKVKYAEHPFEAGGKKFTTGSLVITRAGNDHADFDRIITQTAARLNHEITPLASGFVEKGADLGSSAIRPVYKPRVLLVTGDGVSAESMGEVWNFFEQEIDYPLTLARYRDLEKIKLGSFDVAIFTNGVYEDFPSEKLQSWVRDGGKLIAMENAVAELADKKGFELKKKDEKKEEKADSKNKTLPGWLYEDREKAALSASVPGAIYKLKLDNTHPLGFGLPPVYYSLKLSDQIYEYLGEGGWNVGTVKKDGYVSGFVGHKSREKIRDGMLLGVQSLGKGTVVYMADDPIFRSFWENGKLLFGNAVFMVGQ